MYFCLIIKDNIIIGSNYDQQYADCIRYLLLSLYDIKLTEEKILDYCRKYKENKIDEKIKVELYNSEFKLKKYKHYFRFSINFNIFQCYVFEAKLCSGV